ncbi:hypothetical protein ACLX1H_002917 [Fusarium chlamydosporum]
MAHNCSLDQELKPYSDISGPGVVAGFLGTAWLAVIFVLLHYLFAFDPYENPFESSYQRISDRTDGVWRPNPIDVITKDLVDKSLKWMSFSSSWAIGIEMSILGMCDVQFVTGLSILLSGAFAVFKDISSYHFLLITRLAWFSNLTHLCGLTVLRKYFHIRPVEKRIRIVCMFTIAIMLLIAIGPTLLFDWDDSSGGGESSVGTYVICFFSAPRSPEWQLLFDDATSSRPFINGVISMLLLLLSLLSRTIKFQFSSSNYFKKVRKFFSSKIIHRISLLADRGTETTAVRAIWVRRMMLYSQVATLLVFRLHCDLLASNLSDVYWLMVFAIWGTIKLFKTKYGVDVDENDWTFGQVLPVLLLIGPVVTAAKGMFDQQAQNTNPGTFGSNVSQDQNIIDGDEIMIIEPNQINESPEMSRFRQDMFNCIGRNYYDIATCPWILPLVTFICIQVLEITILMFVLTGIESITLVEFGPKLCIILYAFLSATYMITFAYLVFACHGPAKYRTVYFLSLFFVILGLYSMSAVWSGDEFILMFVSSFVASMACVCFILPAIVISNR